MCDQPDLLMLQTCSRLLYLVLQVQGWYSRSLDHWFWYFATLDQWITMDHQSWSSGYANYGDLQQLDFVRYFAA